MLNRRFRLLIGLIDENVYYRGRPHVLRQLARAMARPFKIPGDCLQVSASLGLAFFYDRTQTAEELLRHADMAMYKAKELGKNQFILFEQEMADANQRVLELKEDCLVAITEHQFFLLY